MELEEEKAVASSKNKPLEAEAVVHGQERVPDTGIMCVITEFSSLPLLIKSPTGHQESEKLYSFNFILSFSDCSALPKKSMVYFTCCTGVEVKCQWQSFSSQVSKIPL